MKKEAVRMSMALQKAFGRTKEAIPKKFKNNFGKKKQREIRKSRLEER